MDIIIAPTPCDNNNGVSHVLLTQFYLQILKIF
jgi:hypothetical protein